MSRKSLWLPATNSTSRARMLKLGFRQGCRKPDVDVKTIPWSHLDDKSTINLMSSTNFTLVNSTLLSPTRLSYEPVPSPSTSASAKPYSSAHHGPGFGLQPNPCHHVASTPSLKISILDSSRSLPNYKTIDDFPRKANALSVSNFAISLRYLYLLRAATLLPA